MADVQKYGELSPGWQCILFARNVKESWKGLTSIFFILFLTDSLERCQTKSFKNMNTLVMQEASVALSKLQTVTLFRLIVGPTNVTV